LEDAVRIVIYEGANTVDDIKIEPATLANQAEVERFIARLRLMSRAIWQTPLRKRRPSP
jgi:propanediol dehydratase small subunit